MVRLAYDLGAKSQTHVSEKEKGRYYKTKKVENHDFRWGSKNHTTTTRLLTIINLMFFREKVKSKTKK